ncbi:unnamed protein product [Brassica rapa subsp. trilocularis]
MGNSGFLMEVVEVNWLWNVASAPLHTGSASAKTLQFVCFCLVFVSFFFSSICYVFFIYFFDGIYPSLLQFSCLVLFENYLFVQFGINGVFEEQQF